MFATLFAALLLAPVPSPAPSPLKEIGHVRSSAFCSALRHNIAPAIGHVLQNDRLIAASRPMFSQFARDHQAMQTAGGSKAAEDLDVARLESLIGPMVSNAREIRRLLDDPTAFPARARSADDAQILQLRAQLASVLAQQNRVLDLISGLTDTQQMGELQQAGNDVTSQLARNDVAGRGTNSNDPSSPLYRQPAGGAPTSAPDSLINAGLGANANPNDPERANDPTRKNIASLVGPNPFNAFPLAVTLYQKHIAGTEHAAAAVVLKAIPACGGHVPAPAPAASPTPGP